MALDENNEVVKLLIKVGHKLNRSPEQVKPFIKTIVEDNWLESIESLKRLKYSDWDKLNLPIRFLKEIKEEIYQGENEKETDQMTHAQRSLCSGINSNQERHMDGNSSSNSNSNNTNCPTPTRNKTKIEHIKCNNKDKDGAYNLSKKIKKSTHEDLMKERENFCPMPNMLMENKKVLSLDPPKKPEVVVSSNRLPLQKEHGEFPLIKFNADVYNEMILCGMQDIEVETIFYFSNENIANDDFLQEDTNNLTSSRDKYDKHSADLYNVAEKLKKVGVNNLRGVIEILSKIIRNILVMPHIIKTRVLKCSNKIMKERILNFQECVNFLASIGFVLIHSFYVLQKVNCIVLICAYESLENLAKKYNMSLPTLPKKYFNPYKASIICTDAFKATNIVLNDNSDEMLKQKKEELNKLMSQVVDLNPKIYLHQRKTVQHNSLKEADMSDVDEYNSNDDVSYIMSKIKNLYKEQTFQSKTRMELQKISKAQVYVKTVLKILFPDQYVLELNFSPCTSMKDVHDTVKQFLHSNIASKEWFIYEPPIIKRFDFQKKLTDYNLVPCAFLRFKTTEDFNHNIPSGGFFSDEAIQRFFVNL